MPGLGIFSISGKVVDISDDTYGDNKQKRIIVVETDNGYWRDNEFNSWPQTIPVEFTGQRIDASMQVGIGSIVTITGRPRGREYQGKYYCNLDGDSIQSLVGDLPESGHIPVQETVAGQESTVADKDDDLPF